MSKSLRQIRKELEEFGYEELGVEVIAKEDSKFMDLLAFLVYPFNRDFKTRFVTTIGRKVYGPRSWLQDDKAVIRTLAHEFVHTSDWLNMKPFGVLPSLFPYLYLFPQILTLGAFGALGAIWGSQLYLLWLLCLLFLLPLPAPGRAWAEYRGYAMSMAMRIWMKDGGIDRKNPPQWITENFVGANYYFMWPFRKATEKRLAHWIYLIECGEFSREVRIARRIREIVSDDES